MSPEPLNTAPPTKESILIIGGAGTGKTDLAGSAPHPYVMVVGDRRELDTYFGASFQRRRNKKPVDILYDVVTETVPLTEAERKKFRPTVHTAMQDKLNKALEDDAKGIRQWETLVIENCTTLGRAFENQSIFITYDLAGSTAKTTLNKYRDNGAIINADTDYRVEKNLMQLFLEWLLSLDKHIILIAHERIEESVDRGTRVATVRKIEPAFVGTQRSSVPSVVSNCWRCTTSGQATSVSTSQTFTVQTSGDDKSLLKSRVGGILKPFETNLDISEVIKKFQAAKGGVATK